MKLQHEEKTNNADGKNIFKMCNKTKAITGAKR